METRIMGIINVTPDSFSDGGLYLEPDAAVNHAKLLISEGADIIDIGGESTRPGSEEISVEEELVRVLPVIKKLANETLVPISIDTYKPEVAEKCILAGASIINDIYGLRNPQMREIAAKYDSEVVITHMKGTPKNMQEDPYYSNVIQEIYDFFKEQIQHCKNIGISRIILDPGIGFGKELDHNLSILKELSRFTDLGYPLLVGTSRKSFIGKITGAEPMNRLGGTIASITTAIMNGANIIRVHDVKECKQATQVADAIKGL